MQFFRFSDAKAKITELAAKVGLNVTPSSHLKKFNAQAAALEQIATGKRTPELEQIAMNGEAARKQKITSLAVTPAPAKPVARTDEVINLSARPADNSSMVNTQLSATIEAQRKELAMLSQRVSTLTTAVEGNKPKQYGKAALEGAVTVALGAPLVESLKRQTRTEAGYVEALERNLFYNNLSVGSHSFSHIEERFGARKPLFGLRRFAHAQQQSGVNTFLRNYEDVLSGKLK